MDICCPLAPWLTQSKFQHTACQWRDNKGYPLDNIHCLCEDKTVPCLSCRLPYSTDSYFHPLVFVLVSWVFHDKYQSYKYEKIQQGNLLLPLLPQVVCLESGREAARVGLHTRPLSILSTFLPNLYWIIMRPFTVPVRHHRAFIPLFAIELLNDDKWLCLGTHRVGYLRLDLFVQSAQCIFPNFKLYFSKNANSSSPYFKKYFNNLVRDVSTCN